VQLSPRGSHNNAGHRISNQEQDQTHTHQYRATHTEPDPLTPTNIHKHTQTHRQTDRQSIAMAWTVADCKKRKWGNHKFTQICKCLGPGLCVSLCE